MQKGQSARDIAIGADSGNGITTVSAAYTVLPTDRMILCTGTGTYTITLCPASVFPANTDLLIRKVGGTGEVTVATPTGGTFVTATVFFTQDGLTAADDFMWLRNIHGIEWGQVRETTT